MVRLKLNVKSSAMYLKIELGSVLAQDSYFDSKLYIFASTDSIDRSLVLSVGNHLKY